MNILLWVIQVLAGCFYIFAGVTKLYFPPEVLAAMGPPNQIHLPDLFMKFIGVCEILGGLGLILPGLLRIKRSLTPLAAICLLIIMVGAIVVSILGPGVGAALPAFVGALLCVFVAYGRRSWLTGA